MSESHSPGLAHLVDRLHARLEEVAAEALERALYEKWPEVTGPAAVMVASPILQADSVHSFVESEIESLDTEADVESEEEDRRVCSECGEADLGYFWFSDDVLVCTNCNEQMRGSPPAPLMEETAPADEEETSKVEDFAVCPICDQLVQLPFKQFRGFDMCAGCRDLLAHGTSQVLA